MKAKRQRKVVGISLGDRSLLVAEVIAAPRPQVKVLAEMVYPAGATFAEPQALGAALRNFLKEKNITATAAVIGLPVKWLVVKAKEVPPADDATLADLLRISVESEFPSDLKDLVFDFSSESGGRGASRNVMILGTPKRNVETIVSICQTAGITPTAITPSALVLGTATAASSDKGVVVLAVGSAGAELSVQRGAGSSIIRHLRPPTPEPPFVSELRRTVSMLPKDADGRGIVLWDSTGISATSLGEQLGMRVSNAELDSLGVDSSLTGTNGDGSKFAGAVALALAGIEGSEPVDFLHSRLAPLKQRRISQQKLLAILAAVLLVGGIVFAYVYLDRQETTLTQNTKKLADEKDEIDKATQYVNRVSFAQFWHAGDPLYLACLRDVTNAMPLDGQTFATTLEIKAETPHSTSSVAVRADAPHTLAVTLTGKTLSDENVNQFINALRRSPERFTNIHQQGGTVVGRTREWAFTINFTYVAPKPPTTAPSNKPQTGTH